jgi:hypothetical protein
MDTSNDFILKAKTAAKTKQTTPPAKSNAETVLTTAKTAFFTQTNRGRFPVPD